MRIWMGTRRQRSSTSLLSRTITLSNIFQLIKSIPTPALKPIFLNPSPNFSPAQVAPTPIPTISVALTEIQYVTVPATVTVQGAATIAVASTPAPTPSPSPSMTVSARIWETGTNFTLDDLGVQRWTWGKADNVALLSGLPVLSAVQSTGRDSLNQGNVIQVRYPAGSINPANQEAPQGGMGFYASPLNISRATNVTFSYSVFFPEDFEFVKGGKLPGLYGGKTGCSGGANSDNCFSTRLMFREHGLGELYLYAPKGKQGPSVCKTRPVSYCNVEYGYSIGRGAWNFTPGAWTDLRQDVWLNTNGTANGGFNVWVNGKLVIHSDDVYYRNEDKPAPTSDGAVLPSVAKELGIGATPLPAPIALATAAASQVTAVVGDILPPVPTAILDNLLNQGSDTSVEPSADAAAQAYLATRLRSRDVFNSTYYEREIQQSPNTTSTPPTASTRYLGAFVGLGYAPGYATLDNPGMISTPLIISPIYPAPTLTPQSGGLLDELLPLQLRKVAANALSKKPVAKFIGIMGDTFFGGHDPSWASPKEQYTFFNSFKLVINNFEPGS